MSRNASDIALEKLEELIKQVDKDFSESDTRAKIIDPLFFNCLGWNEKDVRRETHIHEGYLDYIFHTDETRRFVVEAKKIGESFNIPVSFSGRYYKIGGTISTDNKIKKAIEQAQQYCINSGVRYGIISNGNQYIIFEGFRHGSDWRDGQCVVFRSLEDIKKNFGLFWNILNKDSVRDGSLRRYVSKEDTPLEFFRPIDNLHSKDASVTRNYLSLILQPFIDCVFADIISKSQLDVLKRCYVVREQYKDAGVQINRHFDRPPGFAKKYNIGMIFESETEAGKFQELYERCEEFLRTQAPKGSLILIMGGIGSGKTTFIHHFFNFDIKRPDKTLWFYVNFLEASPDPAKIEDHIFNSIVQEFERKYQKSLADEMASVGLDSIKPDSKNVTILFSMLTLKGYTLSLVFFFG